MKAAVIAVLDRVLSTTGLQYLPVRVRDGIATGARWTLYPWSAYWRGTQEPAMHAVLAGLGDIRGWSIWDLGAHFGIYSIGLARRVGPGGAVAAFEPNPFSHARLERHRRMNRLDWMQTFQAAVSNHSGSADIYTYGDLKSTTTHLPYDGEIAQPATRPIRVPTVVLDELVAAGRLRPPQFVKVDVEGHAHHALAGARATLAAHRPVMIVGLHSDAETHGVLDLLEPLGYDVRPIGETANRPVRSGDDALFTPRK